MLDNPTSVNKLAAALASYTCVSRHNAAGESEGGTLAVGFSDLEKSFQRFVSELLPKLVNGNLSEEEVFDLLLSIGEEFRHIDYHLRDSQFYKYLWENP